MEKLKNLGIALMLMLGVCSCSEDGPSMGDIQENLEGEWFCVNFEKSCSVEGKYSCSFDFNNQTEEGIDTDGDNWDPMKLRIEATDDAERFYITALRHAGYGWNLYGMFDCLDNSDYITIAEDNKTIYSGDDEDYYTTMYIEKLSKNELVIVEESTEHGEESHKDKNVYKFRRIVEETED